MGVSERALGLIETATMTGRIQVRQIFPGPQLQASASLWAEASHWACDVLNHTATTANPASKSTYDMWRGSRPPVVVPRFLKSGCCKIQRENKPHAKTQCYFLARALNYYRDSVRVLTSHRAVLITRYITWKRVTPVLPGARTNEPLFTPDGVSIRDGESTSSRGGGVLVDEPDDDLAHLNDVGVMWGFDLDAFVQECRHLGGRRRCR